MGAPLSPLWPGGPRGARTGDREGRAWGGGREERRGGGKGVGRVCVCLCDGGAGWLPL